MKLGSTVKTPETKRTLDELYREVKNRRFSLLVACTYDPTKRTIKNVDALTPIYRSEGVA